MSSFSSQYEKPDWKGSTLPDPPNTIVLYTLEGILPDSRPYQAEVWVEDDCKNVTFFFSTRNLIDAPADDLLKMIEDASIVEVLLDELPFDAALVYDAKDQSIWSLNVCLEDSSNEYAKLLIYR